MKLWCRGQRHWTCPDEGDVRVDLTGAVAGVVTAAEAEYRKVRKRLHSHAGGSSLQTSATLDPVERETYSNRGLQLT
ncbi:ProQ/FINO family protein [Caballeronia novacaledonica]|uniref:ProQ/FINO family protein n=1 Tax=Caballeronia novacaledonica TaxID=1544861 RepID=UPI003857A979